MRWFIPAVSGYFLEITGIPGRTSGMLTGGVPSYYQSSVITESLGTAGTQAIRSGQFIFTMGG